MTEAGSINPCYIDRGTRVGAYEILDQIDANGGFGCLWKVRRDGKVFALKIGRQRFTAALDAEDRLHYEERLDREIAALKTLHHPNIVRIHTFDWWPGLEDGFPYLVMDYVDGVPLYTWQETATPSLDRICQVFERLAGAIEHMHSLGIYHRDLKSQNVLVRADGEPVIVDFGIARPRVALNVTQAATVGTITHYSPEYARYIDSAAFSRGEPFEWKPTTDLHAVGYMLYDLLTGQPPYPYEKSPPTSEAQLLVAIKHDIPARPTELNPRVPEALSAIAMALLEKEPASRPQSARELAAMLAQARENARAAEDHSWERPFDLPTRPGGKAKREASEEKEVVDVAPPLERRDGEESEADDAQDAAGRAPARTSTSDGAALDLPPPTPANAAFVPDESATGAAAAPPPGDAIPGELREAMARLGASAPRKGMSRAAIGAGVLVVGVVGVLFVAANMGPTEKRPQTLLSDRESRPPAAVPSGSGSETTGIPAAASGGGDSGPSASDAKAIDEALAHEFGRPTVLPDGRLVMRPVAAGGASAARDPQARTAPKEPEAVGAAPRDPPWLHRSTRLTGASATGPSAPRPVGVPLGAHMRAKLLTNLDSRTIGSGPVEAVLTVPVLARGQIVLPARTLAYGNASESSGRFTVRFSRLRLPDDTEVEFEGLALARDDGKPGLAAARRIQREPDRQPGLGTKIAKGTGNILLDTISGGVGQDVARSAGQAALNHEQPAQSSSEWAILLDEGVVFDIWVEHAF